MKDDLETACMNELFDTIHDEVDDEYEDLFHWHPVSNIKDDDYTIERLKQYQIKQKGRQ